MITVNKEERRTFNGKGVDNENTSAMDFNTVVIGQVEAPFEDRRTSPNDLLSFEPALSQNPDQTVDLGVDAANFRVDFLLHVVKLQTALLMGLFGGFRHCLADAVTRSQCCLSRIGAGEIIDSLEGMKLWKDGCQGDAFGESWQEALLIQIEIYIFRGLRDGSALAAYGEFLLHLTFRKCEIASPICCELENERRRKHVIQLKREASFHNYFLNDYCLSLVFSWLLRILAVFCIKFVAAIGEPGYVGVNENVAGKINTYGCSRVAEDLNLLVLKVHELATTALLEGGSNVEVVEDQVELYKVGEKLSWEARVDALNGAFPSGEIECRVGRNEGCLDPMTNGCMLDLSELREMTRTKKDVIVREMALLEEARMVNKMF
ncbi:hypothetical protein GQ457_09G007200 [Hibiscus cannabinus]